MYSIKNVNAWSGSHKHLTWNLTEGNQTIKKGYICLVVIEADHLHSGGADTIEASRDLLSLFCNFLKILCRLQAKQKETKNLQAIFCSWSWEEPELFHNLPVVFLELYMNMLALL